MPQVNQPAPCLQGLSGQATRHQQAWQLGQITSYRVGQRAAGLKQFGADVTGHQQRGKHRVAIQAYRRVQQAIAAHNALALMPEQPAVATNIQL